MIKRLLRKLEATMAAVAFAEEGDAETARQIMADADANEGAKPQPRRTDAPSGFRPHAPVASGS